MDEEEVLILVEIVDRDYILLLIVFIEIIEIENYGFSKVEDN